MDDLFQTDSRDPAFAQAEASEYAEWLDGIGAPSDHSIGARRCLQCGGQVSSDGDQNSCAVCGGTLLPALQMDLDALDDAAPTLSIHRVLTRYLRENSVDFTFSGAPLSAEQILQPEGVLPVIAIEAMRLWQIFEVRPNHQGAESDTFGVQFVAQEGSFFPYSAHPPAVGSDSTSTLRLLVFLLAMRRVLGIKEDQTIDLTPFIAQWDKIDWSGDLLPEIPVPEQFDANYQRDEFKSRRVIALPRAAPAVAIDEVVLNPFPSQQTPSVEFLQDSDRQPEIQATSSPDH